MSFKQYTASYLKKLLDNDFLAIESHKSHNFFTYFKI